MVPVTYIKAGETPANWFDLSVIDRATGKDVRFVVEANTKEGWVRQQAVGRDGRFLRLAGEIVTKRIEGDFAIVNPGIPGAPVAVQEGPGPRTFATTRVFFDRPKGATLAGPGGETSIEGQHLAIFLTLCGKGRCHVSEWMSLAEAIWPDPDAMPDAWLELIRVRVCELRAALKSIKSEITIVTHWGRGFSAMRPCFDADNDNKHEAPAASASV